MLCFESTHHPKHQRRLVAGGGLGLGLGRRPRPRRAGGWLDGGLGGRFLGVQGLQNPKNSLHNSEKEKRNDPKPRKPQPSFFLDSIHHPPKTLAVVLDVSPGLDATFLRWGSQENGGPAQSIGQVAPPIQCTVQWLHAIEGGCANLLGYAPPTLESPQLL